MYKKYIALDKMVPKTYTVQKATHAYKHWLAKKKRTKNPAQLYKTNND